MMKNSYISPIVLCLCGVFLLCTGCTPNKTSAIPAIDHLIYAVPDLDEGVAQLEKQLGVRAVYGGHHVGIGTQNALIALGPNSYLEIFAPDPSQIVYRKPRPFHIDTLTRPRLIGWAAKGEQLEVLSALNLGNDQKLGEVIEGSRTTGQGEVLRWMVTNPRVRIGDGLVPFFIHWGDTKHPAIHATGGVTLEGFTATHPNPETVRPILKKLDIALPIARGDSPALKATLQGPNGTVVLQ